MVKVCVFIYETVLDRPAARYANNTKGNTLLMSICPEAVFLVGEDRVDETKAVKICV